MARWRGQGREGRVRGVGRGGPRRGGALRGLLVAGALAAAGLYAACGDDDGGQAQADDPRVEVLDTTARKVALPMYRAFARQAVALASATESFCAAPSAAGLEASRAAWSKARRAWKQADVFAFHPYGPYTAEPLRLGPKIDFWPAREDALDALLEGSDPLDGTLLTATQRGLPAIEYLLFGPVGTGDGEALALFEAADSGARRCAYLEVLTAQLKTDADAMVNAWDPNGGDFVGEIASAGDDSETFDSLSMAVNEVFGRFIFSLEDLREFKIGKPLGKRNGGAPQPNHAESRFSGESIDDALAALQGVLDAYTGDFGGNEGVGFEEQVSDLDAQLDADFQAEMKTAAEALEAIEGPLSEAVVERPDQVENAYQAIKVAHVTLGADIANLLGVSVSFNNTDAD